MKARYQQNFSSSIRIALLIIIFSIIGIGSSAATEPNQPGWQMVSAEPVSHSQASEYYQQLASSMQLSEERALLMATGEGGGAPLSGGTVEPEIAELARGLKYDPDLMYRFVHDHIEYTPGWGDVKGAYMTLMDRSGNCFDQASLLIALLKEAENHNGEPGVLYNIQSPQYVHGTINSSLSLSDYATWLGVPEDGTVVAMIWGYAGIPFWEHVWVKVKINGVDYVFDPSFKTHSYKSGIDLADAMGYNQTVFLTHAKYNATITNDYVRNINKANIVTDLMTYSTAFINDIKTNHPDAVLEDIIGGKTIEPAPEVPLRQSSLSYASPIEYWNWGDIADGYRTHLQIQHGGIDITLHSSEIYGRRLILSYNGSHYPELRLNENLLATGTTSMNPGDDYNLTITINHPYAAPGGAGTYCDESKTLSVKAGGTYCIVNGWGQTGVKIIEKHREILQQKKHEGLSDSSEPVWGETFAIIGYTWLAENAQNKLITDRIANTTQISHHVVGICGQYSAPYIDLPMSVSSTIDHDKNISKERASWITSVGLSSALEWGAVRQLQPNNNAVSTVKLIDIANNQSDKIFNMTKNNHDNIISQLRSNGTYNGVLLDSLNSTFDSLPASDNLQVIIPEHGNLGESAWSGCGYIRYLVQASGTKALGYFISGGYKGGYATVNTPVVTLDVQKNAFVDPVDVSSYKQPTTSEPIGLVTGSYLYDHSDLTIGSGAHPLGLELKRSYNSGSRLEDGPLGLGWTHNFDITATVGSDGFQGMGVDSPIDAAASIVQTYICKDLLCSETSITNITVATLSEKWRMDQMIDNIVTIKQAGNMMQFVKVPDGTSAYSYNPPPGMADKLTLSAGAYSLKNKNGNILSFDTQGRASQWSDPHGNKVIYGYDGSNRLSSVTNYLASSPIRTLTFNYDNNRISSVTDSAGRSVQYGYDTKGNLTTFTDVDLKVTTSTYNPDNDGQITKIYYPTDPVNPFVTNAFDSLGRVEQQTNANGRTYDYYYSYYRTEELQPEETTPQGGTQRFFKIYYFDDHGKTTAEQDQLDRKTTYQYDGQQRLKRVDYPTDNATEYSYDNNHNILSIVQRPTTGSDYITEGFAYIENTATARWFNQLKTHTDTAGNITTYKYDYEGYGTAFGDLRNITYPAVSLPGGGPKVQPETNLTYNTYGQVETETKRIDNTNYTTTKYEYYGPTEDGHGGLKKTIVDYGAGGLNIVTEMVYDSVGNINAKTDPRGNTTTYAYYLSRLLQQETAPAPFGYQTKYEYYADGKLKSLERKTEAPEVSQITSYTYTPTGQKETVRGPIDNIAEDSVGANHGTIYGADWTTGEVNAALSFNGTSDYVQTPSNIDQGSSSTGITMVAWVYPNSTSGKHQVISSDNGNKQWSLLSDGSNWVVYYGGNSWTPGAGFTVGVGTWQFVAVVFNKVGGNITFYKNTTSTLKNSSLGTATNDSDIVIGRKAGSSGEFFDGTIDEVLIFNRALEATEIQKIYGNGQNGDSAIKDFTPDKYPISYWSFDGSKVNLTKYEYDSLDRPWKTTDGEGKTTTQRYCPDGKLWKIIDAKNQDSVTYTYNSDGTLYSAADAKGNTTTYEYDSHIRLKKTIYPNTTFEQSTYDNAGRLATKITRAGENINYTYDELNRLQTKTVPGTPCNTITYEYDLLSRQVNINDASGAIHNDFDKAGRLKGVTYTYPTPLGVQTVQYGYDAAGNRTKLTYPGGKSVRYHYDNLNRLVSICSDDIVGYWDFDEGEGDIAHDTVSGTRGNIGAGAVWTANGKFGNALDFTSGNNSYVDLGENTWSSSELTSGTILGWAKIPNITSMTGNAHSIVDLEGLAAIRFNGQTDKFRSQLYDGSNHYMDGTTTPQNNTWYLVGLTWDGSTTTLYVNGDPQNSTPAGSPVFDNYQRYSRIGAKYDLGSYVKGIVDEVMIFDRALLQKEIKAIYNGTNKNGGAIVRYAYDALSARVSAQYENGTSANYGYDMANRLLSLHNTTNNTNHNFDYSYDNVGNRLNMWVNVIDDSHKHSYTYDEIYQLTYVDYPEDFFANDIHFIYDAAGNCYYVTYIGITWPPYVTNNLNQYTSDGGNNYLYNANGNLTSDGLKSYTYDAENRLITAHVPDGSTITYSYDPFGRRISQTIVKGQTTQTTFYIHDGDQVICEYDGSGILRKKFLYGVGIDETVRMSQVHKTADISGQSGQPDGVVDIYDLRAMAAAWLNVGTNAADLNYDGKINNTDSDILAENWHLNNATPSEEHYYYHYDGLGSVIALSDSFGNTVEKYQYDVYGYSRVLIQAPGSEPQTTSFYGNPYMFTGRAYDSKTGLYYYRARYYSPVIGRFLQTDPIGYKDSMNLYLYVGNNPIVLIDPWGLCGDSYNYWSALSDLPTQLLEAINDGVIIASNAVTGHLLEGRGIPGWADSTEAIQRNGAFGKASEYLGYVSGGALAGAVAVEALGLDVVLGGGTAASENTKSFEQLVSEAREAYPNKAGIIENHHITPQYLGGAANGPKTQLNAAYHQQITNEFRSLAPYGQNLKDSLSPAELQRIMQEVYTKYPLSSGTSR